MRKIKIAQIGTSLCSHGTDIWNYINSQPELFEVIGYAFPENEREKYPERITTFDPELEMTVDEILNNPEIEAVAIETEEMYLTKYALMAARAGKHIHMEKPGSQNLQEFEELIETVRQNGTVFHTGYMYRYNPAVVETLKEIKNGELGDIISVDTAMSCTHSIEMRKHVGNFKGGMLFFLGCHLIDLIYTIKGMPEKIIPLSRASGLDGLNVEDFGMAVLEYESGVSVAQTNDIEYGGFPCRHLRVVGSKKTVEIKPLEMFIGNNLMSSVKTVYSSLDWCDKGESCEFEPFGRYSNMLNSFAAMVRGEKTNPYTLDYELELYKLILKCCGLPNTTTL
ncbi:MAG: Gfo/Idh/MocA family oxidoreductase [Clostridia bacterium]|nr:Gfo/Idh/MocA family oxidoreductase [Clostridia bacterium]